MHTETVIGMQTKKRCLEVLKFQRFARYMTFKRDCDDFRNKGLRNKIDVSVVLDMECVDMCALIRVFRYVILRGGKEIQDWAII